MADVYVTGFQGDPCRIGRVSAAGAEVVAIMDTPELAVQWAEALQDAYARGRYDELEAETVRRAAQFKDEVRAIQARARMNPAGWVDRPGFAAFLDSLLIDKTEEPRQ